MAIAAATTPFWLASLILCLVCNSSATVVAADELILVVSKNTSLELLPNTEVGNSPGVKPGAKVLCERLKIQGLPRLTYLKRFPNTLKIKVSFVESSRRPPAAEVCFHRNSSIGVGMCGQSQWEKLNKGSWVRSMSPFDHKLLDIRMAGSSPQPIEVSLQEEVFFYRVIFLVLGVVMMTLATFLSNSLVFYYGAAMTVGVLAVILMVLFQDAAVTLGVLAVILMVLFQGMKLLPAGRRGSLAIFLYSSAVGLGAFLLSFLPRFLRSLLNEMGISEDMYTPLVVFLVLFLGMIGAWVGFLIVRKLVLTEGGDIDVGVAYFVAWSIRILAAVMILQSTIDPLLAVEALLSAILISYVLGRFGNLKFLGWLYRLLLLIPSYFPWNSFRRSSRLTTGSGRTLMENGVTESHTPEPYMRTPNTRTSPTIMQGISSKSPQSSAPGTFYCSAPGTFYSTFHSTPERRTFSKDEWNEITKESTKSALENLVSSPDFSKWAVAHADRLTLAPEKKVSKRRWFHWF